MKLNPAAVAFLRTLGLVLITLWGLGVIAFVLTCPGFGANCKPSSREAKVGAPAVHDRAIRLAKSGRQASPPEPEDHSRELLHWVISRPSRSRSHSIRNQSAMTTVGASLAGDLNPSAEAALNAPLSRASRDEDRGFPD